MTRAVLLATLAAMLAPWAVAGLAIVPRRRRVAMGSHALTALLARIGRRLGVPTAPGDLAARLAAAGVADRVAVADAMAIKVGAATTGLALAGGVAVAMPSRTATLALVVGPAAGFVAFDLWLRRRTRARRLRLAAELPDGLDLLRVAVEAGLAPLRAVAEVGRRHRGLLGVELRVVSTRIALGVPRSEAFAALVARCPLDAVATLVAALERAERHGAPLAPALEALATDARAARLRALHDHAARAAPKIQLAIALLLVPGVLLLVGAALSNAVS